MWALPLLWCAQIKYNKPVVLICCFVSSDYLLMNVGSIGNFTFGLRALRENQDQISQSLERLSTGKKINRASDDPSGMATSADHKVRIYAIEQELKSYAQQESYLGAKEGGLSVMSDRVLELNSLVVQAANSVGNSQAEQDAIKDEISSVLESIDYIANTTTFKGQRIMTEYQTGSIAEGLNSLATLAFEDPEAAQELAQQSVDSVAIKRAAIGNQLNSIDSKRSVLSDELINLSASLSSIEDTDFAEESAKLVRAQILEQASIMAVDINRQNAKQALSLLDSATELSKSIN